MKILEIRDIQREEGFIYYRRNFSAVALIQLPVKNIESSINFIIELLPTGKKEIDLEIVDDIEYPLLPIKRALRETILTMDYEGQLP
ncbi:MAG: hypothetical protein GX220_03235 [Treponema sp.]|nr:hypothetical protein [Treponema sp.]